MENIRRLAEFFKEIDELQQSLLDEAEDDYNRRESIEQEIDELAYAADTKKTYSIELAGGGPAVRIHGTLDDRNEPETVELQYQDWFTQWEEYRTHKVAIKANH